ncbi:MAG: hypothetical protein R2932_22825 [Caldilineaceae bacterium]
MAQGSGGAWKFQGLMMVYYADLYLTYLRNLVRLMGQYRADFLIMLTASLIDGSRCSCSRLSLPTSASCKAGAF